MRNMLLIGTVLLAGCSAQMPPPAQVSWAYGAGNGDGVVYPGPAPVFKRAYGIGNGETVTSGQAAKMQYGYGADGMSGTMIRTDPTPPAMLAAPTQPKPAGSSS